MTRLKKTRLFAASLLACFSLSACHSTFVHTAIINNSGGTVKLVEVDYPNASFGTQQIANNTTYRNHFKVQGTGPVTITFTSDTGKSYTDTGPTLNQGQQGRLTIVLAPEGRVTWLPKLSSTP